MNNDNCVDKKFQNFMRSPRPIPEKPKQFQNQSLGNNVPPLFCKPPPSASGLVRVKAHTYIIYAYVVLHVSPGFSQHTAALTKKTAGRLKARSSSLLPLLTQQKS
jgi:hypothetical protein